MDKKKWLLLSGGIVGLISILLVYFGNPANMGFCIACFIRDIAGAVGIHNAPVVQYMRPEVIGLVAGAFLIAFLKKDFNPKGGSSPVIRFLLGFGVMVGALVFLGCPLRMALRIGGGDLNAVIGLIGFIAGILAGTAFLKKGFSLGRNYRQRGAEGVAMVGVNIVFLILLIAFPTVLVFSAEGPGSMHAPIIISLIAGLIVGALAQRTRLCMVGGIRDVILFKDWTLICGFIAIIVVSLIGNIILGSFHPGFAEQPIAHTQSLWNFLGMAVVGLGSVLLGGCPLRQLILTGEGNTDSAVAVIGMFVGAAFAHNFGLASSGAGATLNGQIACVISLVIMVGIGFYYTKQKN